MLKFVNTCAELFQKWEKLNHLPPSHLMLGLYLAFALVVSGCATSFSPRPIDKVPFKPRAQTQVQGGLKVTAAVPTLKEAKAIYGVDPASKHMHPV